MIIKGCKLFYQLNKIRKSLHEQFLPFRQAIYLRRQSKDQAQFIGASVIGARVTKTQKFVDNISCELELRVQITNYEINLDGISSLKLTVWVVLQQELSGYEVLKHVSSEFQILHTDYFCCWQSRFQGLYSQHFIFFVT